MEPSPQSAIIEDAEGLKTHCLKHNVSSFSSTKSSN